MKSAPGSDFLHVSSLHVSRFSASCFTRVSPIILLPMSSSYTAAINNLINQLASLPGIGARSAERIAFHLLKQRPEEAMQLADAIRDVKTRIKHCSVCYNLTESDPCNICSDPSRDQGLVCIVEPPTDL